MRIEAFSAGKDPASPAANEDRFVVLPGRAYAVIDGVTDTTGRNFDGKTSGRVAAETLQAALERRLSADPDVEPVELLALLSDEIASIYRARGLSEAARSRPNSRFGATLALFRHRPSCDEVLLVGDSGIRLDGTQVYQVDKALDWITANLRRAAWAMLERRSETDRPTLLRLSRQVAIHGTAQPPEQLEGRLGRADLATLEAEVVSQTEARFPDLPTSSISALVERGIVNGQFEHQNDPASPLGYSCLDGFDIPERHVAIERRAAGSVRSVELFSDGYFAIGPAFGIAAWENAADEVERVDPLKLDAYLSVKGSFGTIRTDDRTYVGVCMAAR